MRKNYISDVYEEPSNEELGITPIWSFERLLGLIFIVGALLVVTIIALIGKANAEAIVGEVKADAEGFRSSTRVFTDCPATDWAQLQACIKRLQNQALADGATKTTGRNWYHVRIVFPVDFVAPTPTCDALPAPRLQTCPSGFSGAGWQQQPQQAAYPSCAITWVPETAPASVCVQIPQNSATLSWTPPTQNTDGTPLTDLYGYAIEYGTNSAALTGRITVPLPNATTYRVEGLAPGVYYFAIRAINTRGGESARSNLVSKAI